MNHVHNFVSSNFSYKVAITCPPNQVTQVDHYPSYQCGGYWWHTGSTSWSFPDPGLSTLAGTADMDSFCSDGEVFNWNFTPADPSV
jgi:hypothetical protein